jgi:hypothetical protein
VPNGHAAFALSLPAQQPPYFGGLASTGGSSAASSHLGPHAAAQLPGLPSLGDLHAASLQIPKAAADLTGLSAATMPSARPYGAAPLAPGLHTGAVGLQGHLQGSAAAASFGSQQALHQQALQPAQLHHSSPASAVLSLSQQQQQQQQQQQALQFGGVGGAPGFGSGLSVGLGGGLGSNQPLVAGSHGGALPGSGTLSGAGFSHAGGSGGLSLAPSSGNLMGLGGAFSAAGTVAAQGGHQNALLAEHTEAVLADAHQAYRRGQFHEALTMCQAVSRTHVQQCIIGSSSTGIAVHIWVPRLDTC